MDKTNSKVYYYKRVKIFSLSAIVLFFTYFFKSSATPFKSFVFIGLIISFYLTDHVFNIGFKHKHYLFIVLIGVGGILLSHLYFIHPNYDKIQHFVFPILLSSILFFMIDKLNLKFKLKILFVFFSVGTILGIFEIGEYLLDGFFDLKLQGVYLRDISGLSKFNLLQNPLDDTMVDLSFGLLGSAIYLISRLLYREHFK